MMNTEQLFFNNINHSYLKHGEGDKKIICIHGFDQLASNYKGLMNLFDPKKYTVYSLGLVYHESQITSGYENKKPLKTSELKDFVDHFCGIHNISKFSLVGFSLGARIAIVIATLFSDKIEKLLLIAPDGIVSNRFYQILTTNIGNKIFRRIAQQEALRNNIYRIVNFLTSFSPSKKKLSDYAFKDKLRLEKIANTWMHYSKIKVDLNAFFKHIAQTNMSVYFVFGKHDTLIKLKSIDVLKREARMSLHCEVLNDGHHLLKEKYFKKYRELLG